MPTVNPNECEFAQISKQLFLSQLEINHVIQQPWPNAKGHVYQHSCTRRASRRNDANGQS
jgi:hypothetical protein